jgi:hypothetical protein
MNEKNPIAHDRSRARSTRERAVLKRHGMVMMPVPVPQSRVKEYRQKIRQKGIALTGKELDAMEGGASAQKRNLDRMILDIDEFGQGGLF